MLYFFVLKNFSVLEKKEGRFQKGKMKTATIYKRDDLDYSKSKY
jgi:hypothetical protein